MTGMVGNTRKVRVRDLQREREPVARTCEENKDKLQEWWLLSNKTSQVGHGRPNVP